jgi:hypothetical protein
MLPVFTFTWSKDGSDAQQMITGAQEAEARVRCKEIDNGMFHFRSVCSALMSTVLYLILVFSALAQVCYLRRHRCCYLASVAS